MIMENYWFWLFAGLFIISFANVSYVVLCNPFMNYKKQRVWFVWVWCVFAIGLIFIWGYGRAPDWADEWFWAMYVAWTFLFSFYAVAFARIGFVNRLLSGRYLFVVTDAGADEVLGEVWVLEDAFPAELVCRHKEYKKGDILTVGILYPSIKEVWPKKTSRLKVVAFS